MSRGKGKDLKNDVALRAGDVVIVPMSGIAQVGLFVKQWIRDVIPLYGSYNINLGSASGLSLLRFLEDARCAARCSGAFYFCWGCWPGSCTPMSSGSCPGVI